MEIKSKLNEMDLTPDNAIVIGSGILNALKLRESHDIDVVATPEKYQELALDSRFKKEIKREREILTSDLLEIMTSWTVLGKTWYFDNLLEQSVVIDSVRYNTVQFLLNAKRSWLTDKDIRQKDIDDVKLMEDYLGTQDDI
ncbi:MAG: hypothetical protein NTZ42_02235 [Candidatus Gribaldobacteria bacterium]|nr:hypothetical protein [Candidatus Gribaldobacteria bacterium]